MDLVVTISRDGADLTMTGTEKDDGFTVKSASRPQNTKRTSRVTADWLDGAPKVSQVREASGIDLVVVAKATSSAALEAYREELDDALDQWSYVVTVTEDGVTKSYTCDEANGGWQEYDAGQAAAYISTATYSLTIPIPGA